MENYILRKKRQEEERRDSIVREANPSPTVDDDASSSATTNAIAQPSSSPSRENGPMDILGPVGQKRHLVVNCSSPFLSMYSSI